MGFIIMNDNQLTIRTPNSIVCANQYGFISIENKVKILDAEELINIIISLIALASLFGNLKLKKIGSSNPTSFSRGKN